MRETNYEKKDELQKQNQKDLNERKGYKIFSVL